MIKKIRIAKYGFFLMRNYIFSERQQEGKAMKKILTLLAVVAVSACSLLSRQSDAEPEREISYKCGNKEITVTYENTETVLLKMDGINYLLRHGISASGAKYESKAARMVFWNKGNDNTLIIDDKVYPPCQEI